MSRPLFALLFLTLVPGGLRGQVVAGEHDTLTLEADSSDTLGRARQAQARFERRRIRHFPFTIASYGGECDEHVGRFCSWYDGGDWFPPGPEAVEITQMREDLLTTLEEAQRALPGDSWLLGQRAWYRAETGQWEEALAVARRCGSDDAWWCRSLEGFALHGLGRYVEAASAFALAIDAMDPDQAREWRVPRRAVDRDARGVFQALVESHPDSLDSTLEWLWTLADPLWLVEGNDRLTAHYARWTVANIKRRARNPFGVSWGHDLEELVVRNGWEVGWERARLQGSLGMRDRVVGHKHPEGRDYMPPGRALIDPGALARDDLGADLTRPRSLYAPAYAPRLLPLDGQLAVFPRGREILVAAAGFLPPDTSRHAAHDHLRPWMEPGPQADLPDRVGLFLLPVRGAEEERGDGEPGVPMHSTTSTGSEPAAMLLRAPAGQYIASVEFFSPARRSAGRLRQPVDVAPTPDDIAAISDVLLLAPTTPEPERLEEAVPRMLPSPVIRPGQTFAIAWEVTGLGFRPEGLAFDVSVVRTDRGVLRRIGEFLRLAARAESLELSWEEPGPREPSVLFRYMSLELPHLDPGHYEVRLTLRTEGRAPATTATAFRVEERRTP